MTRIKCFMLIPEGEGLKEQGQFQLYRRSDTGEVAPFLNGGDRPVPPGAMWFAPWLEARIARRAAEPDGLLIPAYCGLGPDGRVLVVKTPGGTWNIDSRANNCDRPKDNDHRCWVRHGVAPEITVDKNGLTCGAGGGSIQAGSYHGYLRNGWLEQC